MIGGTPLLRATFLILKGPIGNTSLIQVMAWHRSGNNPLYEPVMTQFALNRIQI